VSIYVFSYKFYENAYILIKSITGFIRKYYWKDGGRYEGRKSCSNETGG